jgi:hypothetical protein
MPMSWKPQALIGVGSPGTVRSDRREHGMARVVFRNNTRMTRWVIVRSVTSLSRYSSTVFNLTMLPDVFVVVVEEIG